MIDNSSLANAQLTPLAAPARISRAEVITAIVTGILFVAIGWAAIQVNLFELPRIELSYIRTFLADFTPRFSLLITDERLHELLGETLCMALIGAALGVAIALPLSLLAARTISPLTALVTRSVISIGRTIPDLVWALIFVMLVGIGPLAGILTLSVDVATFCVRFFAEAFDDVDPAPANLLRRLGASRITTMFATQLPAAMAGIRNASLFSFERAIRHSVVLGLVGAGGIGIELKVAFDLFQYERAATIVFGMALIVLTAEVLTTLLRPRSAPTAGRAPKSAR